ncbi:hypothetical protein MLD38_018198 [Melastoma candidum]|uniref:Uncharacterized protein n=1 Tax=Melastoma candidum TaxID=119954 RepID=A0ACB9QT91_9MYRT|nr:hypothetical protein MLD38_018198 [Melastoma candidum]
MDYSHLFFGDGDDHLHHQQEPPQPSPKKELQLQGPRPTPLRVSKDSHSIRKPPRHPPPNNHASPSKLPPPPDDPPQPVIIYSVSPKVIHVEESGFMSLVQRLTGLSPSGPRAGDVSPAARFASIERASPKNRPILGLEEGMVGGDRGTTASSTTTDDGFDPTAAGRGSMPGILSPAPSSLPVIPSGFFSPVTDSLGVPLFQDLVMSPLLSQGSGGGGTGAGFFGGGGSGSIVNSPSSAWFLSSLISPSPTSLDLYSLLADF